MKKYSHGQSSLPLAMPVSIEELFTHIHGEKYRYICVCARHEAMVGSYHLLENEEVIAMKACLGLLLCICNENPQFYGCLDRGDN